MSENKDFMGPDEEEDEEKQEALESEEASMSK